MEALSVRLANFGIHLSTLVVLVNHSSSLWLPSWLSFPSFHFSLHEKIPSVISRMTMLCVCMGAHAHARRGLKTQTAVTKEILTVFVCWGYCNKMPQAERRKQHKFFVSRIWRLKIQDPGVRMVGSLQGCEGPLQASPSASGGSLAVLVCWKRRPDLHLYPHTVFFLCARSSKFPLFLRTPVMVDWELTLP